MTSVQLSGYRLSILLVIAALMAHTPSLLAQSAGTGALTGTVTDASGGVIPGVTVTLSSTDTNQTRSTTSGERGSYGFALLPPGAYGVRFTISGFKNVEVSSVALRGTEPQVIDRDREVRTTTEQESTQAQCAAEQ